MKSLNSKSATQMTSLLSLMLLLLSLLLFSVPLHKSIWVVSLCLT